MRECDAELCEFWAGFGCVCEALGISPEDSEWDIGMPGDDYYTWEDTGE